MNAHTKTPRIATLDGIYVYDERTGFYEPFEAEPAWPYPGLILIALILIGWAATIGMGYATFRALEAFAS